MDAPPSYDDVLQASQANVAAATQEQHMDTKITVTDPVKQGNAPQKFISYKVTTRTINPKYKACRGNDSIVLRRFSEFNWLCTKLRHDYPGVVVPPCPEKNMSEKYRLSSDFIETRRQALEVFLNKVANHRLLKHSDVLQRFLEADEASWVVEMAKMKQGDEGSTFIGNVLQLGKDLVYSTKNLAQLSSDDKDEDTEYLQYKEYAIHLDHQLKDASGKSSEYVAKHHAYAEALSSFGDAAAAMSKFESGPAANAFVELQKTTKTVSDLSINQNLHMARVFAAPLKEQHRSMKSLKDAMSDRSTALAHRVQAKAALDAAKTHLAKTRHTATTKPEAVLHAENRLKECEEAVTKAQNSYDTIVETMKEELLGFQNQRSQEMARTLRDFALAQAKLAKQTAAQWKLLSNKMTSAIQPQSSEVAG